MASTQVASFNVTPVKRVHFPETEEKAETPAGSFVSPRKVRNGHNRKRSLSFSAADRQHHFKRRRKEEFVRPTKFLLGGNSRDPLNLGSLADENVNKALNEKTPESSPIPTPKHWKQIEVFIPSNIRDPLNLNVPDSSLAERALISPDACARNKRRKTRNRRRQRTNSAGEVLDVSHQEETDFVFAIPSTPPPVQKLDSQPAPPPESPKESLKLKLDFKRRQQEDRIVSPVVPQPGARKLRLRPSSGSVQTLRNPKIAHRHDNCKFRYGNYHNYYSYQKPLALDTWLVGFSRDWFQRKDVLDIGCNAGLLTLSIAREFEPLSVVGVDIDPYLISAARKNVLHCVEVKNGTDFPRGLQLMYGPIPYASFQNQFPNNVRFEEENYVLETDEMLTGIKPTYDTITCFAVTKWIHLNWGDAGLKRVFKRIFAELRPGGRFILAAQGWSSYSKKKRLTEEIARNYAAIQLYPERFADYLLSEIGFCTCEVISNPSQAVARNFCRAIQVFVKSDAPH